ncbi:type II toxin-antitoxin system RelB/DinJ family antitoxin [Allobaculum sp. JKK-2023]|uniref:type II toxin-antitoxin system RelB/DinJ family antitoxin n=1 Tax=Allobaculum sp. JKK-2023 TaxID=3108943 RepID=UPI002B0549F0|nr:type II toxin-antitoxin system RelB/DinJ family antitoxin [Allobaculum sp. JKK-2023]
MAQTNVSFEMNEKLRDQMEEICDELGMDLEDAFKLFAKKMVNEQQIPFEVTVNDIPNDDADEKIIRFVKISAVIAAVAAAVSLVIHLFRKLR